MVRPGAAALLFLAGAIDHGSAQFIGMALGPAPLLLVLPTAFRRMQAGDRAARWVLIGRPSPRRLQQAHDHR